MKMNMTRLILPGDHYYFTKNPVEEMLDRPHSFFLYDRILLRNYLHEWMIRNSPNGFYSLYSASDLEPKDPRCDDIGGLAFSTDPHRFKIKVELYTYDEIAMLYKLTWF